LIIKVRSSHVENLKVLLDYIKEHIILIKFGLSNSEDQIGEYCADLKNSVQLKTEQTLQKITDLSEQIMNEVKEYEKRSKLLNEKNTIENHFDEIINDLELFYAKWSDYVSKADVKEEILLEATAKANQLCARAEKEKKILYNHIFNGNMIHFNPNCEQLNQSFLGILSSDDPDKPIKPILNKDQMNELMILCEFKLNQKWNLIYKASQDGFGAFDFHQKCDNKKNTFIIIKSLNGNVFGGYTEQSWSGYGFKQDKNAFMFSYINKNNTPLKMNCIDPNSAIICNNTKGPIFGKGFDLFIDENSNLATQYESNIQGRCFSYIGKSYIHPVFIYKSNEAKIFLAGTCRFVTSEIEAYIID